jgi:hypothetical protein
MRHGVQTRICKKTDWKLAYRLSMNEGKAKQKACPENEEFSHGIFY